MNKENYKQTFSGIYPSDEVIERIFEMTEKKTKRIRFKTMLVVAAIIALFACATLTANAATNNALLDGMNMIINGEDVNLLDYIKNHKSYTDKDGTKVEEYEFEVPGESKSSYLAVKSEVVNAEPNNTNADNNATVNVKP
ncbi:MAG: hypothetical protein NC110_03680 [Ruminococcus sp.]|nr:hypothetical protein [Ruminococcus sp.]